MSAVKPKVLGHPALVDFNAVDAGKRHVFPRTFRSGGLRYLPLMEKRSAAPTEGKRQ